MSIDHKIEEALALENAERDAVMKAAPEELLDIGKDLMSYAHLNMKTFVLELKALRAAVKQHLEVMDDWTDERDWTPQLYHYIKAVKPKVEKLRKVYEGEKPQEDKPAKKQKEKYGDDGSFCRDRKR